MRLPWRRDQDAEGLIAAARREFLTQREEFGPSGLVYADVCRTPAGWYLVLAPHLTEGEPVRAVGWARNDYWAVRIWGRSGHDFRNDYDPEVGGVPAPSLAPLGWPDPAEYAPTLAAAKARANRPVMVTAGYRMTDGSFISHEIKAPDLTDFHFADPNPAPAAIAVAYEIGLAGRRWDQHLAAIAAINEHNRRNGIV